MRVRDRHDHYLRGFLSSAETARYETAVATQPSLAAELHARLTSRTIWDPEMAPRARALLNVCEAWFELASCGRSRREPRLNLLRPSDQTFLLAPYETWDRLEDAPSADPAAVARLIESMLFCGISEQAQAIEVLPGENPRQVHFAARSAERAVIRVPQLIQNELVRQLKVLARLDPEPSDGPQRGRICVDQDGLPYHVWAGFEPTAMGEIVTLTFVFEA